MCSSESLPKEFEKTTEILPFSKYGISTISEFKKAEEEIHNLEWLKKVGLSNEEIKLYQENEAGYTGLSEKMEHSVLQSKLISIYNKIKEFQSKTSSSKQFEQPSTSKDKPYNILDKFQKNPLTFYPEGHPMNDIKEIEESLFGHLKNDDIIPITKRRKILRRLERKKERVISQGKEVHIGTIDNPTVNRPGSLWDMKEIPIKFRQHGERRKERVFGPKQQTMYTVKDNKIVRLEPVERENSREEEFRAVDIVVPINRAEQQLLEGTKMSVDDIKMIERFKDYEPGMPSKVLYLKNIAPSVSQDQLSLLFNQFVLENGGPINVSLLSGRMRGQAFVTFQNKDLAIRALEEINGTVLSGRPIIAQFGRNSNRIQMEENG